MIDISQNFVGVPHRISAANGLTRSGHGSILGVEFSPQRLLLRFERVLALRDKPKVGRDAMRASGWKGIKHKGVLAEKMITGWQNLITGDDR